MKGDMQQTAHLSSVLDWSMKPQFIELRSCWSMINVTMVKILLWCASFYNLEWKARGTCWEIVRPGGNLLRFITGGTLRPARAWPLKVIDKEMVLKVELIDQTKWGISVTRMGKHPNVVQLYEVMASKTRIYFVIDYKKVVNSLIR